MIACLKHQVGGSGGELQIMEQEGDSRPRGQMKAGSVAFCLPYAQGLHIRLAVSQQVIEVYTEEIASFPFSL